MRTPEQMIERLRRASPNEGSHDLQCLCLSAADVLAQLQGHQQHSDAVFMLAAKLGQDPMMSEPPTEYIARQIDNLNSEMNRWRDEYTEANLLNHGYREQIEQLQSKLAEAERELSAVACFVEPHWKGAGLPLSSEWILKELQSRAFAHDEDDERIANLEAELKTERENAAKLRKLGDDACRWQFCVKHGFPVEYLDDAGDLLWKIHEHDGYPGPVEVVDALLDAQIAIDDALGGSHADE